MHKKRLEPFATLFLYSFHNNIKKTPFTVLVYDYHFIYKIHVKSAGVGKLLIQVISPTT